jgi:hypothetical protein
MGFQRIFVNTTNPLEFLLDFSIPKRLVPLWLFPFLASCFAVLCMLPLPYGKSGDFCDRLIAHKKCGVLLVECCTRPILSLEVPEAY